MRVLVLIAFLPIWGYAGKPDPKAVDPVVAYYLDDFSSVAPGADKKFNYATFLARLQDKRRFFDSDRDFIRFVFNRVHGKYLKRFVEDASFNDMLAKGRYNCLTATALYALIFHNLEFSYTVFETSNHIFLSINTGSGKVLLETTDPTGGFITDPMQINAVVDRYRSAAQHPTSQAHYTFSKDLFLPVNLDGLKGLLYFNAAVRSYNLGNISSAVESLEKAASIYYSSRIDELSEIIYLTLTQGRCSRDVREALLPRVSVLREHKLNALAMNR